MTDHKAHEEHRINYAYITAPRTMDAKLEALDNEIERVGYICLTDAIAAYDYGGALMFATFDKSPPTEKYRIRVLKDEWGNPPKPGDKVTRQIEKPRYDRAGRKLRGRAVNDMKRRGIWEKKYIETREWEIDQFGCIELGWEDAAWLLQSYGVSFETKEGICGRKELSGGPCKAPSGDMLHVHYWRYEEVPPWVEVKPIKQASSDDKPKRGRPRTTSGN